MEWKDHAINAALVVLSVFVFLAAFEAALVTDVIEHDQRWSSTETQVCWGSNDRFSFHPEFGWTYSPNSRLLVKHTENEPWKKYTFNNAGFRDTFDSGRGTSIVVLGDSFTAGNFANDNASYPHLLDRWTPESSVENFGVGGYGTGQSLLVYREHGTKLNHDTVILTHYMGNDMINNVDTSSRRPHFSVSNSSLTITHQPENVSGGPEVVNNRQLRRVIEFFQRNTETYTFLEPKVRSILVQVGVASPVDRGVPNQSEIDRQTTLTRTILEELSGDVSKNNARLVVVSIPERGEVRPEEPARFTKTEGQPYWTQQRQLLQRFAESRDSISYVSMKPILQREIDRGNRVYGIENAHLNEHGYRVTAGRVYDQLVNGNHIQDSNPDFSTDYTNEVMSC